MNLIRFSPRGLTPWFDDFDRFFDALGPARREPNGRPWAPAVDIFEDEKKIVLKADLPDMDEKEVNIQVEDGVLVLQGERKLEKETNQENYHRLERTYGAFSRSFTLPDSVDADKISASYKKGVMEITLPKLAAKPKNARVIEVK